jgi:hypothetical protein
MKLSFIGTELRRYIRNSSSLESFEAIRARFYHRLRDRGYPHSFLLEAFTTVRYSDRPKLLAPKPKDEKPFPLLFHTTYTPLTASFPIRTTLTTYWPLLHAEPALNSTQPTIGYKRTINVGGMLCTAKS